MINQIVISFIIYFVILLAIGLYFYKKSKTEREYALGDRSLNYWVTAISAQASDMGSWLFLGYPAVVFSKGLFESWVSIGLVFFMFINWHFIAKKIRVATEQYKSLTLASYFESRYKDKSGTIRIISAIMLLVFFTFYISSGLVGMGRLFESAFNIEYMSGIIIGLLVTVGYILIGGFLAVSWCNLFQGIFLLAMIVIVPFYAYLSVGSFAAVKTAAITKGVSLSLFPSLSSVVSAILLSFGWGLGYFGQPHIIVNFMGIKNISEMKKAEIVGLTWQVLVLISAILIGFIGIAFFPEGLANPEHLFVLMAKSLFSPFMAGFALCGILAATLSSVNTQILVSATGLSEDVYKTIINKQASSKQLAWVSRLSTILVALIAFIVSLNNSDSIFELVHYSWSGLGSSFGPLVILSLYSNYPNKYGAIAGILTGGIISGLWPYFNSSIPSLIPGFFFSWIIILLVSKLTKSR